jgi:branched-chain amino acid transport system permease protein
LPFGVELPVEVPMNLSTILQYVFAGIKIGSIYAMVALGFNIIYNTTGIINFAQGEFVMLGGMFMVTLSKLMPLGAAFPITVLAVVIVGCIFERLAIWPARGASVITLIMITVGGSMFLKGVAMKVWGRRSFPLRSFSSEEPIAILGARIQTQTLWIIGVLAVVVVCLAIFFRFTLTGKAMRACAANRAAASLSGISVERMVLFSFGLSAGIGAVAGMVITPVTLVHYACGSMYALKGFAAAVLGGLGVPTGAVVGGLIIGLMECFGAALPFEGASSYKDGFALLVLLVFLFAKPSGIFGRAAISELKKF